MASSESRWLRRTVYRYHRHGNKTRNTRGLADADRQRETTAGKLSYPIYVVVKDIKGGGERVLTYT